MSYRDHGIRNAREIGKALGVAALLEGRDRRASAHAPNGGESIRGDRFKPILRKKLPPLSRRSSPRPKKSG
jgi:hypothetical protein